MLRHLHEQRTSDTRQLAVVAQPFEQSVGLAFVRNGGAGIQPGGFQHRVDGRFGIAMHDAERIARLVEIAEARERELHVAHFAQRAAADDALVGQHFGGGGVRASEFCDHRGRRGSLSDTGSNACHRRMLVLVLAHARKRVVGPGLRKLLEVHVAIDARQQALGAKLGETFVDHAAGFAELGIAGVAECQYGVLKLRQLRRALGAEEFVEPARLVRRIAVAVRADDDVEQPLLGDLARLVVAGLDHARLHSQRLDRGEKLLGNLAAVAGVRSGNDGERGQRRGSGGGGGRGGLRRGGGRNLGGACLTAEQIRLEPGDARRRGGGGAGEIAGQPHQLLAVELGG